MIEARQSTDPQPPPLTFPNVPVAQLIRRLDAGALYQAYHRFGPVTTLIPTAIRAAHEFDIDPQLLVGILLIEGWGRQQTASIDRSSLRFVEWLQVSLGDPDPTIGVMQMNLANFMSTTLRHPEAFSIPRGASSESGWRAAYVHRLQNDGTAIRYAAAHLSDLIGMMRPQDRADRSLAAATYNGGIGQYLDVYVPRGSFYPSASNYRQSFINNSALVSEIFGGSI